MEDKVFNALVAIFIGVLPVISLFIPAMLWGWTTHNIQIGMWYFFVATVIGGMLIIAYMELSDIIKSRRNRK